jgi:hypothetical protein
VYFPESRLDFDGNEFMCYTSTIKGNSEGDNVIETLLKTNNFNGRYVAMKDFLDHTVIADGITPQEAYEKAEKEGYKDPVVTFVPCKDMVQIF